MSDWQSISTAPIDTPVLVYAGGSCHVAWLPHEEDQYDWPGYWLVTDKKLGPFPLRGGGPTHWMPLPEPPSG